MKIYSCRKQQLLKVGYQSTCLNYIMTFNQNIEKVDTSSKSIYPFSPQKQVPSVFP